MLSPARKLDALEQRVREAARASGRIGRLVRYHLAQPGKQIRARIALLCATALDVPRDTASAWAAVCELLHNASLVHDDLIDRDEARRGCPAVWLRFGEHDAVLLGDHLLNAAYVAAASIDVPAGQRAQLIALCGASVKSVIGGAAREISGDPALDRSGYERTVRAKTGRFLSLPVEGALVLARRRAEVSDARAALDCYGIAYQILDDLADLRGTKAGRRPGADLRSGVASAPVVHFRAGASLQERDALDAFLVAPDDGGAERWRVHILASDAPDACRRHERECLAHGADAVARLPAALHRPVTEAVAALLEGVRR